MNKIIMIFLLVNLLGCETWQLRDYQFYYSYPQKIGGGAVKFGVLSGEFVEIDQEKFDKVKHLMVMMPPETWTMLSIDLLKACNLLKKKCENTIQVINSIYYELQNIDEEIHAENPLP